MNRKNTQSQKMARIKIATAVLVVFGLTGLFANTASASVTGSNFFETIGGRTIGAINQFFVVGPDTAPLKADLASAFNRITCFFGFNCPLSSR